MPEGNDLPTASACKNVAVPRGYGAEPALLDPAELPTWVVYEDDQLLALNKPGWVVCHPAKRGPLSSLASAVREVFGAATSHLVHRLDRETTGVVLFAKDPATASLVQKALQERKIGKTYLALLEGELAKPVAVEEPLGPDRDSPVAVKIKVRRRGPPSITHFRPLATAKGYTLCELTTETGRKHQIRVHAQWLNHPVVADKLYGPDESLYLRFTREGWTTAHEANLPLHHHALHAWQLRLPAGLLPHLTDGLTLTAPLDEEFRQFALRRMGQTSLDFPFLAEPVTVSP